VFLSVCLIGGTQKEPADSESTGSDPNEGITRKRWAQKAHGISIIPESSFASRRPMATQTLV